MKKLIFLVLFSLQAFATPLTEHESNGFKSYTSLDSMHTYLEELEKDHSDRMKLVEFGKTYEKRALKYAILSKPLVESYDEAIKLKKTIIVLGFNIHGDERTLRESMLIYMRDLLKSFVLKDLTIIVVPTLNPDGLIRATRRNAKNSDMNRDYIKLEQTALKNFVTKVLKVWKPHVWVDGHNGGATNYDMLYLSATHPNTPEYLREFSDEKMFPYITKKLAKKGYRSFYYARPDKRQWNIGMHHSRIGRNYGGLTNIITVLLEAPNGKDKKTGALVGVDTLKHIVEYTHKHRKEVDSLIKRSRRDAKNLAGKKVALKGGYEVNPKSVSYYYVAKKDRFGKKIPKKLRKEVFIENGKIKNIPVALKSRNIPYGYLIPKKLTEIINMIKLHRIEYLDLSVEKNIETETHKISRIKRHKIYDHKRAIKAYVGQTLSSETDINRDYIFVPTNQDYGRITPLLFEPDSEDSLVLWNKMDSHINTRSPFPILRVMEPIN